ncbi:MAG: hypothetical protein WEF51_02375 [Chloroflexota bacterium]
MRIRRSLLTAVLPLTLLLAAFAAPPPMRACSCIQPEPMAAYRGDPLKLVFVGTITASGPAGVEVAVERWFQGASAAVVRLAGEMFGEQSAGCQTPLPPVGSRWIYVAFIANPGEQPQVNLCTPHARLDTPEGQSMTNDALAAFGSGAPPVGPPEDPEVEAMPAWLGPAAAVGMAVVLGLVVFGAVVAVGRRRRVGG